MPGEIDIVQRPCVLEGGARRPGADGRRVVGVGIEGRVEIDQVDAGRIDPPHHIQIVAGEQRPVRHVEHVRTPHESRIAVSVITLRLRKS